MNEYQKKKLQDQVARNMADKPACKAAYLARKEAHNAKRKYQQTVANLSNGGLLIPKPEALIGGLDELNDMAIKRETLLGTKRRGRPRKST